MRNTAFLLQRRVQRINLLANLFLCTSECHSVDVGHDGLLDNLSGDLSGHDLTEAVTGLGVFSDSLLDQVCNGGIDVGGFVPGLQIDLLGTPTITTQSRIVLKTIASTILMDWQMADIFGRILQLMRSLQLEASGE